MRNVVSNARPEISRSRPGLFVFLVDQSGSMGDPFIGSEFTKADAVAHTVNSAIHNLILNCMPYGEVGDYYHVAAIVYGSGDARLAFGGPLEGMMHVPASKLAANPLREDRMTIHEGGTERTVRHPVWIEPRYGGMTPMTKALVTAREIIDDWTRDFAASIPPIVMNISDGAPSDGDPRPAASALVETGTSVGRSLLFNLCLSTKPSDPVVYPSSADGLTSKYAKLLFSMSSLLPSHMVEMARALGFSCGDGARGFVYNGDMSSLAHFLTIGTTPANVR